MSLFQKIAFFLLLATIPIQLGKHFWPDFSFVQGIRIDYLSPTFYLSDLSFLFLFFCSYNSVLKRFFKILYSRAGALLVICLVLSTIFSANWLAAFYGIVKLFEFFYIGVFVSMFFKKREMELSQFTFTIGALVESIILFFQFVSQHSLGGVFYFLGERTFSVSTPGISTFQFMGQELLRPYGTFPHPNVVAFYLLLTIVWLLSSISLQKESRSYLKIFAVAVISLGVLLTFSRVIILLLITVIVFYIYKMAKNKSKKVRLTLIGMIIFGSILLGALFFQRFEITLVKDLLLRMELVIISVSIFISHLALGTGLNNFFYSEAMYQNNLSPILMQPVHNIYLLWLTQTGIAGFAVAAYFIRGLIAKLLKRLTPKSDSFYEFSSIVILCIGIAGFFDHYFLTLQQGQILTAIVIGFCFSKINS